jgi:hypothetical protein
MAKGAMPQPTVLRLVDVFVDGLGVKARANV